MQWRQRDIKLIVLRLTAALSDYCQMNDLVSPEDVVVQPMAGFNGVTS